MFSEGRRDAFSSVVLRGFGSGLFRGFIFKEESEDYCDNSGHQGGQGPDGLPVDDLFCGFFYGVKVDDSTCDVLSYQHSESEGDEGDEALGVCADFEGSFFVDVYLSDHEEEVITDAVEQDAEVVHKDEVLVISEGEQQVADGPEEHSGQQHFFDPESGEEERHYHEEEYFRHLSEGHFSGGIDNTPVVKEGVCEAEVERERDADEQRADYEDEE